MVRESAVAWVGVAAALALVGTLALPYAVVDADALGVYYGVGPVNPLAMVLFGGVAAVALAAAAAGRADPHTVAGVGVVVGLASLAIALAWAPAAGPVAGGIPTSAAFDLHRWAVVGAAGALFVSSALFATRLGDAKGP
jgi:hypothetical protein